MSAEIKKFALGWLWLFFLSLIIADRVMATDTGRTINHEHSDDVIKYLWWVACILGTLVSALISGVAVWVVRTVQLHDAEIAAIIARCDANSENTEHPHRRKTDGLLRTT